MQQSKLKARINVSNVDTTDRNDEDDDLQPVEEALSPFITVNRTSLPYGGMSKPNRDSNLLQQPDNLGVFEEKTTGESPFSSPRLFGEEKAAEEPELVELKEEITVIRTQFVKEALSLDNIGSLEDSYIRRNDQDEGEEPDLKSPVTPGDVERKLNLEKQFSEYQFKE